MAENQNLAEQQFEQQDADQAPKPVTVDVETGEAEEQQPEQQQPEQVAQPPQQRKRPTQERIRNLTHERDEARNYAAQMQQELEAARRAAAEAQAARELAERAGMENYGARVKAEVSAAERELLAAEEADDPSAKVAAQKKMAKAAAQEADFEAWQQTQPRQDQQQRQPEQRQEQPRQQQQQPQENVPDEATLEFLDQNRWFDAFQRLPDGRIATDRQGRPVANPDFDEDLHDAAMLVHKRIAREVRLGKKPQDYLASPEYFEEISTHVAQTFPDAFGDAEDTPPPPPPTRRTPPMSQTRQPVAPANRQPPAQNGNNGSNGKVTLDGEQASFVRSLVDNGTMRYSQKHPDPAKRGAKMEYKDAYVEYAKRMTTDSGNRQ